MALGTFVAGRYSATWNSASIGMTAQGFELDFTFKSEAIDESDLYGRTTMDLILRGADVHVSMLLKEWIAGSKSLLWALGGGTLGKIFSSAVPPGVLASDNAQALVLTATANTPAAASPASLTASKAWPAENFNPRVLFDSRLRQLPIRLICLPYVSSTDLLAFSTT